MPWHIDSRVDGYCIVEDSTGDVVEDGYHGSDAALAVAHLKALYAAGADVVTAAAATITPPIAPPRDWFDVPEPDQAEPLTFEADGRVHGHLALWDACHVGFLNGPLAECVKPPRSPSNYEAFHLGQMVTDDGSAVSVGKIVYGGPHASLQAGLAQAREHYDRTSSVGAFVRARDGRHGIFLAGATRSDLSPEGLRDMRANPPSGDWRRLRGALELIGALAVGIPGFQTPQVALTAAGGDVEALILPGYLEEVEDMEEGTDRDRSYIRRKRAISTGLTAAAMTTKTRNNLAARDFAIPEDRAYPINDVAHARNALARSSGKPEEARVRRAVCRRYPDMGECASK